MEYCVYIAVNFMLASASSAAVQACLWCTLACNQPCVGLSCAYSLMPTCYLSNLCFRCNDCGSAFALPLPCFRLAPSICADFTCCLTGMVSSGAAGEAVPGSDSGLPAPLPLPVAEEKADSKPPRPSKSAAKPTRAVELFPEVFQRDEPFVPPSSISKVAPLLHCMMSGIYFALCNFAGLAESQKCFG